MGIGKTGVPSRNKNNRWTRIIRDFITLKISLIFQKAINEFGTRFAIVNLVFHFVSISETFIIVPSLAWIISYRLSDFTDLAS
jgi:hypothetical protein